MVNDMCGTQHSTHTTSAGTQHWKLCELGTKFTGVEMSGRKSRNKGAAFERWVANKLTEDLGLEEPLRRNLSQYQSDSLPDLVCPPFKIECKAYAVNGAGTWFQDDWWRQVVDATGDDLMPCLIFKYDRHRPRVVLPLVAINEEWGETSSALYPFASDWDYAVAVIREWVDAQV